MSPQARPPVSNTPLLQGRAVAQIAALTAALALGGLALTLFVISPRAGIASYFELFHRRSLTQDWLGPALWLGGLCLLAISATLTAAVALYASHRVAGPLYRFEQNILAAMEGDHGQATPIRDSDHLQAEAQVLAHTLAQIHQHLQALRQPAQAARLHPPPTAETRQALTAQLRATLNRARF